VGSVCFVRDSAEVASDVVAAWILTVLAWALFAQMLRDRLLLFMNPNAIRS
jgi:hypothetical protein